MGTQVSIFLVQSLGGLYVMLLLLRFLLQLTAVDFYNPIAQSIVTVTQPVVKPLQNLLPTMGRFNVAAFVAVFAVQIALIYLVLLIGQYPLPSVNRVIIWGLIGLASQILNVFFWALLGIVILSWLSPNPRQPIVLLLTQLVRPIMGPLRRVIPTFGGLDFSPIVVLLGIQLIEMTVINSLATNAFLPRGLILGL